jgi:Uma2 family endonuclease
MKRATYEDVLNAPENKVAEILDGELVLSPRPAMRHSLAASTLGGVLGEPFGRGRGGPGGWWILDEPELHLGKDVLVPDLAGWRRERMPSRPETAYFPLAPDWVCEVLSPSTAQIDRARKLAIYARERVTHAWLVDPLAQTLEVFQLEGGRWVLLGTHAGQEVVRAQPFDDIEIELASLWA